VRKSAVYGDYYYGDGYYSYANTQVVKNQIQTQERAVSTQMRFNSAKELEDATAQIRRTMTAKYGVEF
jgi:excinuclease UvrABC nuclease subunit